MKTNRPTLEDISSKVLSDIARHFPVTSASDEFIYFPQAVSQDPDWQQWDRFSPGFIKDFIGRLSLWENDLDQLQVRSPGTAEGDQSQVRLLKKVILTLREQLDHIRVWQTQPSFYLTIVSVGMAQALEAGGACPKLRAGTLSGFLDQAGINLDRVPAVFRDIGLEMVPDTRKYLMGLLPELPGLSRALESLKRFEDHLKMMSTEQDFIQPKEIFDRIVQVHINCGMDILKVDAILDQEIREAGIQLEDLAKQNGHNTWQDGYAAVRPPAMGNGGILELYRDEVARLGRHFHEQGIVSGDLYAANPVRVKPVPGFLTAIRAASSYSIPPKHPPDGGDFYVINAHDPREVEKAYHKEYRILTAHETWPGHHLLDICRWNLASDLLRAVEQPVFYEGWACFAEKMLGMTGYLKDPMDHLIVAKRRLWRAIRGKVDLGLQTGSMTVEEAAHHLSKTGMTRDHGRSCARKYLLNPGYQLCYTIGLEHFGKLHRRYGDNDLTRFVQTVLHQGEINFTDLEKILKLKSRHAR